ncbi:type II toxin-antitoxin system ParD family antitoxin [Corynebacterium bouchesdurhonense]|uniref:type II toxin-antitoxin system ParD family antitoxin n=1 Tax=Corynebacterium bouchesdurhonense TaxID=1720192 RepID=UPI000830FD4C|nr:type II toxin-antitoxin system ParD family antitoxin [Corynebacterium bouchesdurhonense]
MARNTSVTLGDHYHQFVSDQIASGRFETASEVMRAGLRLLEERDQKMAALNAALKAGEESGFREFDVHEFLNRAKGNRDRLDQ